MNKAFSPHKILVLLLLLACTGAQKPAILKLRIDKGPKARSGMSAQAIVGGNDYCYAVHTYSLIGDPRINRGPLEATCSTAKGPRAGGIVRGLFAYGADAEVEIPVANQIRVDLVGFKISDNAFLGGNCNGNVRLDRGAADSNGNVHYDLFHNGLKIDDDIATLIASNTIDVRPGVNEVSLTEEATPYPEYSCNQNSWGIVLPTPQSDGLSLTFGSTDRMPLVVRCRNQATAVTLTTPTGGLVLGAATKPCTSVPLISSQYKVAVWGQDDFQVDGLSTSGTFEMKLMQGATILETKSISLTRMAGYGVGANAITSTSFPLPLTAGMSTEYLKLSANDDTSLIAFGASQTLTTNSTLGKTFVVDTTTGLFPTTPIESDITKNYTATTTSTSALTVGSGTGGSFAAYGSKEAAGDNLEYTLGSGGVATAASQGPVNTLYGNSDVGIHNGLVAFVANLSGAKWVFGTLASGAFTVDRNNQAVAAGHFPGRLRIDASSSPVWISYNLVSLNTAVNLTGTSATGFGLLRCPDVVSCKTAGTIANTHYLPVGSEIGDSGAKVFEARVVEALGDSSPSARIVVIGGVNGSSFPFIKAFNLDLTNNTMVLSANASVSLNNSNTYPAWGAGGRVYSIVGDSAGYWATGQTGSGEAVVYRTYNGTEWYRVYHNSGQSTVALDSVMLKRSNGQTSLGFLRSPTLSSVPDFSAGVFRILLQNGSGW